MMADGKDLGEDRIVNETLLACISLSRFFVNIMSFSLHEFAFNITTHHQMKTSVRLTWCELPVAESRDLTSLILQAWERTVIYVIT